MSETMKVALTFTAIDAASGYVAGLERRIDSLGAAGDQLRKRFDAMRSDFTEGLKGFGVAYTSMQFMKPGLAAAAALESSGISVKNSLAAGGRSAAQMAAHYNSLRSTALYLSSHSPFAAPEIMRAQKLLLDSGFKPGEIVGRSGLTAQVAGMSQLSGQSLEAVREMAEIFDQQFGAGAGGIGEAFDWIAQSGMEDKLPELATGLTSMGTRASAMKIPVKDAITTIGMLEHVARRSGAAIGAFLQSTRPDAASSQAVRMRDTGLQFYNTQGNFIGMEASQKMLKAKFGGIQGDRMKMLEEIFGQGALAAEGLIKGEDLAEEKARAERSLKLSQKVEAQNKALTESYDQMTKAGSNAIGSVFAPLTEMLASTARGGRNTFEWLSTTAENHPKLATGVAGLGGLMVAGGTIYGLTHWIKAIGNFKGVVGGLSSVAVGIAAGKAVEKASGVTPVFVTNWPGAGGGPFSNTMREKVLGGVSTAAGGAAGGAVVVAPGLLSKVLPRLGYFGAGVGLGYGAAAGADWISERLSRIDFSEIKGADNFTSSGPVVPDVTINLDIDKDGRVVAKTGLGTELKVNSRGSFHTYE